jgi:hypothetical protein
MGVHVTVQQPGLRNSAQFPADTLRVIAGSPTLVLGGPRSGKTSWLLARAEELLADGENPIMVNSTSASVQATRELMATQFPQLAGMVRATTALALARDVVKTNVSPAARFLSPTQAIADLHNVALNSNSALIAMSQRDQARFCTAVSALGASWLGREEIVTHAHAAYDDPHTVSLWESIADVRRQWSQIQQSTHTYDLIGTLVAATYALHAQAHQDGVIHAPTAAEPISSDGRISSEPRFVLLIDDHHRHDFATHRFLLTLMSSPRSRRDLAVVSGDPFGPLWRGHGRSWLFHVDPNRSPLAEIELPPVPSERVTGSPEKTSVICAHRSLEAEAVLGEVLAATANNTALRDIAIVLPPHANPSLLRSLYRTANRYGVALQQPRSTSQRVDDDPFVRMLSKLLQELSSLSGPQVSPPTKTAPINTALANNASNNASPEPAMKPESAQLGVEIELPIVLTAEQRSRAASLIDRSLASAAFFLWENLLASQMLSSSESTDESRTGLW